MIDDELLHKWINGTITESELVTFKERPEYTSLKSLYDKTAHLSGPSYDANAMLQSILNKEISSTDKNENNHVQKKAKTIPLFFKIAVAASALFLLGTFLFTNNQTIKNNTLAEISHDLPRGSEVKLFPGSEYSIDEKGWDQSRNVQMKGKAYFVVTKGSPFIVQTNKGRIEVLGTSFLVDAKEDFKVNCDEGMVQVYAKNMQSRAKLEAGESYTILDNGGMILNKKGLTKLTNMPLEMILNEMKVIFDVEFKLEDIDLQQKLTSGFQHDNLENALKTVTLPLNLQYSIDGSEVSIIK